MKSGGFKSAASSTSAIAERNRGDDDIMAGFTPGEPGPCRRLFDRNLLFGILALQNNFISREQLLAAFNAWIVAKEKPLDQILLAQNALDADTRALLDALVAKHLAMHGNDPQQSLAALSSLGSGRQYLQQLPDADVQASLAIVSRAASGDSHETRAHSVGESSAVGQRFRPGQSIGGSR